MLASEINAFGGCLWGTCDNNHVRENATRIAFGGGVPVFPYTRGKGGAGPTLHTQGIIPNRF